MTKTLLLITTFQVRVQFNAKTYSEKNSANFYADFKENWKIC